MSKKWQGIVIHCSDSEFGDNLMIDDWHKEKGWSGIGYHFVITNGVKHKLQHYLRSLDGQIQSARSLDRVGAHARGYNQDYIGICLIGKKSFTKLQFRALQMLVIEFMGIYGFDEQDVIGHYQCKNNGGKTCPNFDVDLWWKSLSS